MLMFRDVQRDQEAPTSPDAGTESEVAGAEPPQFFGERTPWCGFCFLG